MLCSNVVLLVRYAEFADVERADDAGESAVGGSVGKNRALGLEIGGKSYGEAGFAKQFEAFAGKIHRVEEVALREQRNRGFFGYIGMEFEGAGIFCRDDVDFGRGADSNEAEAAIFLQAAMKQRKGWGW